MAIKLTAALKKHATDKWQVPANATDAVFSRVIGVKMATGALTGADYAKLTADTPPAPAQKGNSGNGNLDLANQIAAALKMAGIGAQAPAPVPTPTPTPVTTPVTQPMDVQGMIDAAVSKAMAGANGSNQVLTPERLLAKNAGNDVRVKSAAESYSSSTKAAYYPERCGVKSEGSKHMLAGLRAKYHNVELNETSQLDKAISGAYFKWSISTTTAKDQIPYALKMTDHDMDLMHYAMRNSLWSGLVKGKCADEGATKVYRRKLNDFEVKTLLDDSISGGIEIAPVAFDDAIILIPVLYGELFPLVNTINIARGRRMKGAAMQNPTFTSGIAEGTAIQPYNTSSFISAFDTAIFPAVAAMEIGQDFEEDSPADIGSQVVEQYGLKALEWLDRVVAIGDGVTEPLGVFTGTGTTVVNSDNGMNGPITVSDMEGLMFGVAKQYRNEPGANPVYVGNDTMYRRARAIPVGPGDERRVLGMDHGSYQVLEKPFKISNYIPNGKMAYVNLRRYRMYRRLGLSVRIETAGRTLALNNSKLIVLRMRFGGQLEVGGAAAIMTDAWF